MNDAKILVCCHKKDYFWDGEEFLPIHVGKALNPQTELEIQGDDIGDNISTKNPNFCELTAQYWMWKNGPESKYVGLNHYRRYFDFNLKLPYGTFFKNVRETEIRKNPPSLPNLDEVFESYDIILAKPNIFPYSVAMDYIRWHIHEDYDILRQVVAEKYPNYIRAFDHVMRKSNRLSHYNMFVVRRKVFDEYSKWLFDILFEVESRVKISPYPAQARIFGYMSERLLNVYVKHHRMKVKYVPIIKVCEDTNPNPLKQFGKAVRNNITNFLLTRFNNDI